MQRVIQVRHPGGPEVMELGIVPLAEPRPGEVRVRHTAIGVNYIDIYHRSGLYPLPRFPHALGMEAAGVVEAIGPGVTEVKVGERVAYASGPPGSYAEARVIQADRLVPLPAGIEDRTAAAILLKGMTVEYLIRRTYPVKAGELVLWHAAAGGVGLLACQWLRHLGAIVIGTVSTEEKAELARAHGCHHAILYTREDFVTRVRELTQGQGVGVVYDSVGRATFARSLDCLRRRGMLVSFGNASGKPEPFDTGLLSAKGSLFLTRPILFDYTAERRELLASAEALFDVVRQGIVKVRVSETWELAEAAAAHTALEARRTTGSTLLLP
jgi:NADPH2:quinone reductase